MVALLIDCATVPSMPLLAQAPKPAGRGPMGTLAERALISAAVVLMRVIVVTAPALHLVTHLPHRESARLRPTSLSLSG